MRQWKSTFKYCWRAITVTFAAKNMKNKINIVTICWTHRGVVVQAIDFRANTLGFEARLCYLIYLPFFYLFGIECCYSRSILATTTHPTLLRAPIFHQQEDQDSGFTFFNAGGLDRVCFVNRPGGTVRRVGWVTFTKIIAFIAIIIHIPRPPHPCIWRPASHTWCP